MEKNFKRKPVLELLSSVQENYDRDEVQSCSKQNRIEVNLADLPADPGLRIRISDYHPNDRDKIRRAYIQKGPCQPRNYNFPQKKFSKILRRFNPAWFDEYPNWLEYSIAKDATFCLCCYLFKPDNREQGGGDSFVVNGFSNWKKKERLQVHVGGLNSSHNQAWKKYQDLMLQEQQIQSTISKQLDLTQNEYRICLNASIDCIRFLVRQGLTFCGHNESDNWNNQENFLDLLQFLANHDDNMKSIMLQNTFENLKLTWPDIQRDIVTAATIETTNIIIKELGNALFSILIGESCDVSTLEKVTVVLRYVDQRGGVVERFLGIVHAVDTTAVSLKVAIETLFAKHGLSIMRLRGQSYDKASNMHIEFNSLKALIMKENEYAFHVHCFAHQLQSTLVDVAKNHIQIALLFHLVANLLNVVGVSCKRRDILNEKRAAEVINVLKNGELSSDHGLNQESTLKQPGNTCWSSHYGTLVNLIVVYSSVIDVLEIVMEDGLNSEQCAEASLLLDSMQSFDFAFSLHLMKNILGVTHALSQTLQRKDQDIVNAICLVKISKQRLQMMRDNGWDALLNEVSLFGAKHNIVVPKMDDMFITRGQTRCEAQESTNLHHYRIELFYAVIDMQLQELNNRFTEVNTELLLCLACLNPTDSFSAFDKQKLIRFAQFYPVEFSAADLMALDNQLETYIMDIRSDTKFSELKGIMSLAEKMVATKKNILYPLVYLLVTLALILPVATATVERDFSAMHVVENRLCNRMGDQWMNDYLITYIEKDIFIKIDNDVIIQRIQNMKTRGGQL